MLVKEGSNIFFTDSLEQIEKIPEGNYLLKKHDWRGFYLKESEAFYIPNKLYGDTEILVDRYLNTFNKIEGSIGLLFTGFKGSGKSLISKLLSNKSKLPVLIVSEYYGPELISFLASISEPVVILFDEFEKVYNDEEKQNDLLTILDGVFSTRKMFIFTSNTSKLNPYLMNRPGRIYYHKSFNGLNEDIIEEVVEDLLEDKTNAEELIEITKALGQVSVDSLKALIQEMNFYNETAREALKHLNISVENARYQVTLILKGKSYQSELVGHPLSSSEYHIRYKGEHWWEEPTYQVKLYNMDVTYGKEGKITLRHKEDSTVIIFERIKLTNNFEI